MRPVRTNRWPLPPAVLACSVVCCVVATTAIKHLAVHGRVNHRRPMARPRRNPETPHAYGEAGGSVPHHQKLPIRTRRERAPQACTHLPATRWWWHRYRDPQVHAAINRFVGMQEQQPVCSPPLTVWWVSFLTLARLVDASMHADDLFGWPGKHACATGNLRMV